MSGGTELPEAPRVPLRARGFAPRLRPVISWASLVGLVLLWQGACALGLVSDLMLPSPRQVGAALKDLTWSGELWGHLVASVRRILAGWVVGTAAGLGLGFAMGIFTVSRSVGLPLVSALFPVPKIALLPLFVLWFGIGEPAKVATIAFGVFFPTVVSAYAAVDAVPRTLVRMAQSFDLRPAAITRKILLPGALPGILSGFRISASIALLLVVAAEMIGAERGIGTLILTAGHLMQTDRLLAGVAVLSALGLAVGGLLNRAERWLLRWR